MKTLYQRYRDLDYPLPPTYLSWDLFGAGPEHLGKDGRPVEMPLREPSADEVLLRVDAIGLCFSDTKLIWAGNSHPRIPGRDLAADPTVPGHEAAMTVVKAGANWASRFAPGERYIIQADISVNGKQRAFGYVHRGALAQYTYAGPDVLAGDAGCYLLPMSPESGYAEAALVEPWACVEDAYHLPSRKAPVPGGTMLLVTTESGLLRQTDFRDLYLPGRGPRAWAPIGADRIPASLDFRAPADARHLMTGENDLSPESVQKIVKQLTGGEGFDDIFVIGPPSAPLLTALDAALAKGGCLVLAHAQDAPPAPLDIGRAHYHNTRHLGAPAGRIAAAYTANAREDLAPGGAAWMVGAAGPMGQMHMQRALELDNPPALLCGTDVNPARLAYMRDRLTPLAAARGVRMEIIDSSQTPDLAQFLAELAPGGFSDIYVHAPVPALVTQASAYLAQGGILNIFAGVGVGTMATLDPSIFTKRFARMIGSSGSSMESFKNVFARMESGRLATRMSMAALGGIEAGHAGILGVKENRFPGKTVIYSALRDVPLVGLDGLAESLPGVAERLERGAIWTNAAEEALLETRWRPE